jgi:IS605 OrfB family transposase
VSGKRKGPKAGLPRFRSRKDSRQSVRFTANARFKVLDSGKLRLPKVGDVAVRWSRPLPSAPSSVTVIRDAAGRLFASFVVEVSPEPLPETGRECGIDLGLGHFAVLDDGTKVSAPRFLRRAKKKLRRAHKDLSRKQKGSGNREKARVKVARAHVKVADARRDFHHKLSTQVIRENQAVTVEDLAVKGLARTKLAKSVHDAGWSAFVNMLEYKARLYGREFRKAGRFEPTSQVCSACGIKDGPKPLHVREWTCSGVRHRPRPRRQRREKHPRPGTQGEAKRPWRPGKTSGNAGAGRRSGKPQRCRTSRHGLNPRHSRQGARQSDAIHSSVVVTSAWRGKTFSVSTRCTSASWSAQASASTVSR